jgi:hypothetical protein
MQQEVRNTINNCQQLKYVNSNPTAPTIRGLIKVHKEGAPIRLIVNWKNAPAYNLAKMVTTKLHTHTSPSPMHSMWKTQSN